MAITKNLVNIGNAGISGDLTAATFKKRNGTDKQILFIKMDITLLSNKYFQGLFRI